jgi:uncharacterized protein YjiK
MDKTPIKIIAVIIIPILIALLVRFVNWDSGTLTSNKSDDKGKEDFLNSSDKSSIKILTTWLLPKELLEVSGISWMDEERFACVQDELGKVFIFNIRLNKIEQEISFAEKGDYEGVAVVGNVLYVLDANGTIFEIGEYNNGNPKITVYKTHLKKKQDAESLAYDKKNNRLLVAVKSVDLNSNDYKGIYAFDLKTKRMEESPVYKIDLNNKIFDKVNKGKIENSIRPSDLAIHPLTGDIYILEGTKPKLLIMNSEETLISLYDLKGSDFPQAEGIAFSADGKMYISNEGGNKEPGNILQVELKKAN